MSVQILFFGQLTDKTGCSSATIENPQTIGKLKSVVIQKYPDLATAKFTIALNNKIAFDKEVIAEDATIALMPPFSGG
jgi:molybdopterin synthase sulfur carrier subunit